MRFSSRKRAWSDEIVSVRSMAWLTAVVEAEPEAPAKKALPILDDGENDSPEQAESSRAEEKRKAKVDLKEIRAKHERKKAGNA